MAIMGPSGCGKSTFFNCLANKNMTNLLVEGSIRIDGVPHVEVAQDLVAYVQQDDLFFPTLTVREHLVFHAQLRMHKSLKSEIYNRIQRLLESLGLKKCEDTLIGLPASTTKKYISGGERKRLLFATELLANPSILLCDEPTSGLDSFMAQNVVSMLQTLASEGKTILCTIHQPSSDVFTMFDRLLLLAEGRTAYLGATAQALTFFQSMGFYCPSTYNPADYYIQLISVQPGHEHRDKEVVKVRD